MGSMESGRTPKLAYRVREVQEALGIGRDLVYDLINTGQLGHVKAGKAVLVPAHALAKFLGSEADLEPGRWWRVLTPTGALWCETSDEREARDSMRPGDTLQRQFVRTEKEWRNV